MLWFSQSIARTAYQSSSTSSPALYQTRDPVYSTASSAKVAGSKAALCASAERAAHNVPVRCTRPSLVQAVFHRHREKDRLPHPTAIRVIRLIRATGHHYDATGAENDDTWLCWVAPYA
jgi:hypothetical protein